MLQVSKFRSKSSSLCFDKIEPQYEPDDEFDYDEDSNSEEGITLKQKIEAVNYWKSTQKGKRKFSSVKANFRFLTNESQLYQFEKQIKNYGTRKDKLKIIWDHTLDEFKNAMQKMLPVHDNDIRR
jgi:hypothetical protein